MSGAGASLPCAECGYDLTGITEACPECGYAVASSLASGDLTWASPRWLGRVRLGVGFVLVGLKLSMIFPLMSILYVADQLLSEPFTVSKLNDTLISLYDTFAIPLPVVTEVMFFTGYLLASAREPGRTRSSRLRVWITPLAWSSLIVSGVSFVIPAEFYLGGTVTVAVLTGLNVATAALGIVTLVLFARYITGVLRRHPDHRAARQPGVIAVWYGAIAFTLGSMFSLLPYLGGLQDFVYEHWNGIVLISQLPAVVAFVWLWVAVAVAAKRLKHAKRKLTRVPPGVVETR